MKVEVLFPEICNLYGELENIKYLKKSCPHIEVIETAINDRPLLVSETPDLIYMGTMTESSQQLAIRQLSGYRQRIEELMKDGANFLITGNALEVFGKRIEDVDGTIVDGLGLVDITTKRDMMNRFNSLYIGTFDSGKQQSGDAAGGADPMKIVGFVYSQEKGRWDTVAGVNVTLGLPIIRVSVDHGTAFDQAGTGLASEQSLRNAVDYAICMEPVGEEKTD